MNFNGLKLKFTLGKILYSPISILFVFVSLVSLRINGSSFPIIDNQTSGNLIGEARGVRADEFQRFTPMILGRILNQDYSNQSALSVPSPFLPRSLQNAFVYPDKYVFSFLPRDYQFSALWFSGLLLTSLGVYFTVNLFAKNNKISILTASVTSLAPGIWWWSYMPAEVLGRTLIGLLLLYFSALKKNLISFIIGSIGTGILLGAFFTYAPLAIVFMIILAPVFLYLLLKEKIAFLAISKLPILLLQLLIIPVFIYISYATTIHAMINTIYPGERVSSGGSTNSLSWFFSGVFNHSLLDTQNINSSNQSEISLGFGFFILLSAFMFLKMLDNPDKKLLLLIMPSLLTFLWLIVPIPAFKLNPFSKIPVERMSLGLSLIAPIIAVIIWIAYSKHRAATNEELKVRDHALLVFSVAIFLIHSYQGNYLRTVQKNYDYVLLFVVSLVISLIAYNFLKMESKKLIVALYLTSILGIFSVITINPVNRGVDAYYSSPPYSIIDQSNPNSIWASDNFLADAFLIASARKSISGQQIYGPVISEWKRLDPTEIYHDNWNNGASYVLFEWKEKSKAIKIINRNPDQINILIDPCNPILDSLNVAYLVSSRKLVSSECLRQLNRSEILKPNGEMWIYQRRK